jgi:hypothetical protein
MSRPVSRMLTSVQGAVQASQIVAEDLLTTFSFSSKRLKGFKINAGVFFEVLVWIYCC